MLRRRRTGRYDGLLLRPRCGVPSSSSSATRRPARQALRSVRTPSWCRPDSGSMARRANSSASSMTSTLATAFAVTDRAGSVGRMTESRLEVRDHGDLIVFSFEDLHKSHGRQSIGGLALGFKVLERALPLLAGGDTREREDISIDSAFGGGGARDAFEMVARAVTGGHFRSDPDLAPDAPASPMGTYFFRFTHSAGTAVELTLRPGLVADTLVDLATRGPADPSRTNSSPA